MRRRAVVALAAALSVVASVADAGSISVPLNHTVRLPVARPAASVVVGNPAIADVSVVDSHTVFAVAKGYGSTDVTVIDALGRTVFSSQIDVAPAAHGHVAVYRGGQRSDLACDPNCSTNGTTAPAPYQTQAAASSSSPTSSALAAGLVAGALIGGASRPPFAGGLGSPNGGPR